MKNQYLVSFKMDDGRVLYLAGDDTILYAIDGIKRAWTYTNKRRAADLAKWVAHHRLLFGEVKSIDILPKQDAIQAAWADLVERCLQHFIPENDADEIESFRADLLERDDMAMDCLYSYLRFNGAPELEELDDIWDLIF